MAEYNMAELFEDVYINIPDGKDTTQRFKLRMRTASVTERMAAAQEKMEALQARDEATEDEYAAVLVEIVDIMLEPQNENGATRSHAKTLLSRALKNETLGPDEILALSEFIQEQMESRRRPPSARPSDG